MLSPTPKSGHRAMISARPVKEQAMFISLDYGNKDACPALCFSLCSGWEMREVSKRSMVTSGR